MPSSHPGPGTPTGVLAADLRSIISIGVDDWQRDFSWPVGEAEFRRLVEEVDTIFAGAYEELDDPWSDLLVADIRFRYHIIQFLHAAAVTAICQRQSVRILAAAGNLSPSRVEWATLGSEYTRRISEEHRNRPYMALRQLRRRFIYNRHLPAWRRALPTPGGPVWSLGPLHQPKLEYIARHRLRCGFPFLEYEAARSWPQSSRGTDKPRELLRRWLVRLASALDTDVGAALDAERISNAWIERLAALGLLYDAVRRRTGPKWQLLVSGPSNAFIRTTALAAMKSGAKVTGFFHGHHAGYKASSDVCYTDLAICNEFVTATANAAKSYKEISETLEFTRNRGIRFVSMDSEFYRCLWRSHEGRRTSQATRSVMLVGFPMSEYRYNYGTGLFAPTRLDLELRLLSDLRAGGFRTLYKPHPATVATVADVMRGRADEVLTAPFEDVYRSADILLFTYVETSTFGFAVCTDSAVVLLDFDESSWNARIRNQLQGRCAIVPSQFDARNRIDFDVATLLRAVKTAPAKRDYSYVHEFLIPNTAAGPIGTGSRP